MRTTIRVEGVRENIDRLDQVGTRARRPEKPLRSRQTVLDLYASERRRFQSGRFPANTQAWAQSKRRRGMSPRRLVATGRLERQLTSGGSAIRFSVFNGVLRFGVRAGRSDLYYAQALAKGVRGRPRTRFVTIDRPAKTSIIARVERYIADGIIA